MASLGFRHPQFSEDLGWLPAWLQRDQVEEASDEYQNLTTPSQSIKDLVKNISQGKDLDSLSREEGRYNSCYLLLSGEESSAASFSASPGNDLVKNISQGKDLDSLSREEGRYNSCYLLLSGEESSAASFSASPGNVLHFHLNLSSNGASQYTQSELFNHTQAQSEFNKFLSLPQDDTSVGAGKKSNINKVLSAEEVKPSAGAGMKTDDNKVLPLQQAETLAGAGENADQLEIDNDASDMKILFPSYPKTQKNLSIQSLVSNQDSARCCEEKLKKVSYINDAVELSISASEALAIHELVKSESASEDFPPAAVIEAALQVKKARLENQAVSNFPNEEIDETHLVLDLDDSTMTGACEDVGLSSAGSDEKCVSEVLVHQNKLPVDPAWDLNSSRFAGQIDPMLLQSIQETSHVLAAAQPEAGMNSFHAWNSSNAGKDEDRFRSRWFGGWTGKEADAPAQLEQSNRKSIQKFYINETSSLSESADVAPDANSFVQKHETGSKMASQSSMPFEGFNNKVDEEILISQDLSSSTRSFIDPLCSVVPCSVSTVDTNSPASKNQNVIEADAQKQLLEIENLRRTSEINVEFVNGERQDVPAFTVEGFENPVQRKLTLLKTYSSLSPRHDSNLEKGRCYHNQLFPSEFDAEFISLEQKMSYIRSLEKEYSIGLLSSRPASKFATGRENEETYYTIVNGNPCPVASNCTENNDKLVRDGSGLQLQPFQESRLPAFLNQGTCHTHASKVICDNNNFLGMTSPSEAGVQETIVKLRQRNDFFNIQSSDNSLETQIPIRKRTRLSEVEVELQQNRAVEKLQSSHKFHSATRASEMPKHSNACRDSRVQDVKRCFSSHRKYGKRLIFQGIKFLLTGFSSQKEEEIEGLIQEYGGLVLSDIPPPKSWGNGSSKSHFQRLPIVICPKKLKTTKFLYGCAVNAFILKVRWLTDSVLAGSMVAPEKYMILSNRADLKRIGIREPVCCDIQHYIFGRVGIMLHGKQSFYSKFAVVVEHGGGQVFKTLHWLVQSLETRKNIMGVIVVENERRVSRHLRHCILERKIPMLPASWIIKSLHFGKLLPSSQNKYIPSPTVSFPEVPISVEWSEEI